MPTIASLIRQKLQNSPNGATTQEIATYCLMNGAKFNSQDINKSVSAQLSKMNIYHIDIGGYYVWSLYPKSYYSQRNETSQTDNISSAENQNNTVFTLPSVEQPKQYKKLVVEETKTDKEHRYNTKEILKEEKRNNYAKYIKIGAIVLAILFILTFILYSVSSSQTNYEIELAKYERYTEAGIEYQKPLFIKYYFEPSFAFFKLMSVISIIMVVYEIIMYLLNDK